VPVEARRERNRGLRLRPHPYNEAARRRRHSGRKFNGTVDWVEIDPGAGAKDAGHLISPQERLHGAMALQQAFASPPAARLREPRN
jgi:hypothetical protein